MLQRIINNVFLRNLVVLVIFRSPDVLQRIAQKGRVDAVDIREHLWGWVAFFIYFIFHNRVLYEKLLLRKKYFLYVAVLLPTLFIWREGTSYLMWLATKTPAETTYAIPELKNGNVAFWAFIYWADIVYIYISFGVYLSFKYFTERTRLLQADNIRKELELKQLNAQLNPHFLFNALNNIYSHQLRSADSGELILKLGELMRYILDSSKKQTVPIAEELAFIENYIAFEKERLGDRCEVRYDAFVANSGFRVVPLILFNFIENAFKHGTTSISRTSVIINIEVLEEELKLSVENNAAVKEPATVTSGVGLENTGRRLALLYEGMHDLAIAHNDGIYKVSLTLKDAL